MLEYRWPPFASEDDSCNISSTFPVYQTPLQSGRSSSVVTLVKLSLSMSLALNFLFIFQYPFCSIIQLTISKDVTWLCQDTSIFLCNSVFSRAWFRSCKEDPTKDYPLNYKHCRSSNNHNFVLFIFSFWIIILLIFCSKMFVIIHFNLIVIL